LFCVQKAEVAEGQGEAATADAPAETKEEVKEPEGPKTFTLAEFKAQQAANAAKAAAAKPARAANEGTDVSQWASAQELKRDDDAKASVCFHTREI
jgi:GH25 family lysozyme M1 (1,4-beta-N-acetylmuramidase)